MILVGLNMVVETGGSERSELICRIKMLRMMSILGWVACIVTRKSDMIYGASHHLK